MLNKLKQCALAIILVCTLNSCNDEFECIPGADKRPIDTYLIKKTYTADETYFTYRTDYKDQCGNVTFTHRNVYVVSR